MNKEKKEKLIELILIIGSILISLKIPETKFITFDGNIITKGFMFVIFFSIVYFILIQQEPKKINPKSKLGFKILIDFIGLSISIFFSIILASILVYSNVVDVSTSLTLIQRVDYFILFLLYLICSTFVLFGALKEK